MFQSPSPALFDVLKKFGHPQSTIKEYDHWILGCRQKQITLGSAVLICKDDVISFSAISEEAFGELSLVIRELETNLKKLFEYDKINYLMLMMVDPYVHFHVLPRYSKDKKFDDITFKDYSWPKAPDLSLGNEAGESTLNGLASYMRNEFTK